MAARLILTSRLGCPSSLTSVTSRMPRTCPRICLIALPFCSSVFRSEPKKKKVMVDLYRVTPPDDPVLENGNKLCKGKPVAYVVTWKPEKAAKEIVKPFQANAEKIVSAFRSALV